MEISVPSEGSLCVLDDMLDPFTITSVNTDSSDASVSDVDSTTNAFDAATREEINRKIHDMMESNSAKTLIRKIPEIENYSRMDEMWVETCHKHLGNLINLNVQLPEPCIYCQRSDGHGQKGRAFRMPILESNKHFGSAGTPDKKNLFEKILTAVFK